MMIISQDCGKDAVGARTNVMPMLDHLLEVDLVRVVQLHRFLALLERGLDLLRGCLIVRSPSAALALLQAQIRLPRPTHVDQERCFVLASRGRSKARYRWRQTEGGQQFLTNSYFRAKLNQNLFNSNRAMAVSQITFALLKVRKDFTRLFDRCGCTSPPL